MGKSRLDANDFLSHRKAGKGTGERSSHYSLAYMGTCLYHRHDKHPCVVYGCIAIVSGNSCLLSGCYRMGLGCRSVWMCLFTRRLVAFIWKHLLLVSLWQECRMPVWKTAYAMAVFYFHCPWVVCSRTFFRHWPDRCQRRHFRNSYFLCSPFPEIPDYVASALRIRASIYSTLCRKIIGQTLFTSGYARKNFSGHLFAFPDDSPLRATFCRREHICFRPSRRRIGGSGHVLYLEKRLASIICIADVSGIADHRPAKSDAQGQNGANPAGNSVKICGIYFTLSGIFVIFRNIV